jgi:hypothetical protein
MGTPGMKEILSALSEGPMDRLLVGVRG